MYTFLKKIKEFKINFKGYLRKNLKNKDEGKIKENKVV